MKYIDDELVDRVAFALLEDDQKNGHADPCCSLSSYKSAARAAIAAMPSWQPIESAPKDQGENILVYSPYLGAVSAYWLVGKGKWVVACSNWECEPTRWMFLPAPPIPEEEVEPRTAAGSLD